MVKVVGQDNTVSVEGYAGKALIDPAIVLEGKNGKDGKDGKDGVPGPEGLPGRDGVDGVDGKDGKDGRDGVDGKDGVSYWIEYDKKTNTIIFKNNGGKKNPDPVKLEPLSKGWGYGVGRGGGQVQADWNQTDKNSPTFIKNKPEVQGVSFKIVDTLPTVGDSWTIYLIESTEEGAGDKYEEWIYVYDEAGEEYVWEKFGTEVDLSPYRKASDQDTIDAGKVDKVTTASKVYGTDASGNQTTYDKDSFGQVDDVKVNGTSVVSNKVASVTVPTQPSDIGAATSAQGAKADTAIQPSDLGTAAYASTTDFATSAQGALADSALQPNSPITGATKCKITYDSNGLVTGGSDLEASDIPSLTISKISDITATASELNVLDGITASTTELNYLDGVTSSIQTQLDGKQQTGNYMTTDTVQAVGAGATKTFNGRVNFIGAGDSKAIYLSTDTRIDVYGTSRTVLGFASGTFLINNAAYPLNLRGSGARPAWNGTSYLALTSDIGNATLTIQKNGTAVDTFTANATSDKTINITVPTQASDVNALPDSTKYGASLSLSINSSTYVVTAQLKDQDGNSLGSAQTIDLPLESVVVSGSYDDATKKIILTLQSGSTIEFSVADLVSGLQTEITSNNMLDADLVDDSTSTNKFVTSSDITSWNGKVSDVEVNGSSVVSGGVASVTVPTDTSDLTNGAGYITGITSSDVTTALGYTPYDDSNPDGYITGITSGDITTALGYTPYNSSNPNGYQANVIETVKVNGTSLTPSSKAVDITVPTNNNQLTNGAGYITSSALSGYATETWVGQQGYLTSTALNGYATQQWVGQQGFITGITSSDVTTALGYTPYDASNPNGYTSNTGTVTSVNNVSPVNGNVSLSIPTVNNPTITITQGGVTKGSFTLNQSTGDTIALDAGGGTVDQTYDSTSTNAQSGTAVAGAISGKVDLDLNNMNPSATAKETIVGWGMPDLTRQTTLSVTTTPQQATYNMFVSMVNNNGGYLFVNKENAATKTDPFRRAGIVNVASNVFIGQTTVIAKGEWYYTNTSLHAVYACPFKGE